MAAINRGMTKAQQIAMADLFARQYDCSYENARMLWKRYLAFRRRAYYSHMQGCYILRNWQGMTIGIEKDGYARRYLAFS